MGLPFLNARKIASVIIAKKLPNGSIEPSHEEGLPDPAMLSAAEDLLSAISMKDASKVAAALSAAFNISESSEPEGEME